MRRRETLKLLGTAAVGAGLMTIFDDAKAEGDRLYSKVTDLQAEIARLEAEALADEAEIARLQAELDACMAPPNTGTIGWNMFDSRFGAHRVYSTFSNRDSQVAVANQSAAQGLRPLFSLKPPKAAPLGWQEVANGLHDAFIVATAGMIQADHDFCFHHEPEDDAPANGADFKRAFDRVATLLPNHARPVVCLSSPWTWNPASGRNPDDWVPAGATGIALDCYNWFDLRGDPWVTPEQLLTPALTYFANKGDNRPVQIWETNSREDPADPNRKAGWLHQFADLAEDELFDGISFYDSSPTTNTSHRLFSSSQATQAVTDILARPYFAR